jgi:hypothetical protein
MINKVKKYKVFFPFLVSFYFSVLLAIKNAFKRVFIFKKMTKTVFLIPN